MEQTGPIITQYTEGTTHSCYLANDHWLETRFVLPQAV